MKYHFTTEASDHRIAFLAALAISIHIFESALPSPLPGVKLGLANIITLFTFLHFGWRDALYVSLLRVVIGSLLLGTFLSPTFILSLSGALFSFISLICLSWPFHWISAKFLSEKHSSCANMATFRMVNYQPSAIGYAVIASMSHTIGQFFVAWYFFIPHPGLFKLLPIFITFAVILGVLSGIITQLLLNQYDKQ